MPPVKDRGGVAHEETMEEANKACNRFDEGEVDMISGAPSITLLE